MRGNSRVSRIALGWAVGVGIGLGWAVPESRAQPAGTGLLDSYRVSDYFIAPGWYGMSYGFASYGMPQTHSVFSAYPGPSYGANYPPYGLLPGRYGVGLWRPGYVAPGYVYGASYYPSAAFAYRTFPVLYGAGARTTPLAPPPPVGVYAPALGPAPPAVYGW
jgi:hypothetical protein